MEDRARIWNDYYQSNDSDSVHFDNWIARHERLFRRDWSIIEFGCGFGYVSEALLAAGWHVLSTDLSSLVLEKVKRRVPSAQVMKVDLEQPLPFPENAYDGVVADLCLHYFDGRTTAGIIREFRRILTSRGYLFCRVNSAEDVHYGAGQGREMERGFYDQDGHYKRFFDERMIKEFFCDWEIASLDKYDISRHERPKNVYEIVARNAKTSGAAFPKDET
jgi:SAM-dependent methyltransferase